MASADRIYCTTTDEGTGDIELDPTPFSGEWFMPPSSLEGKEVDYSIVHRTQVEVETGSCIYSHSTLTLLRGAGTASRSTAGEGTKVDFSPGVKDVIFGFGAFGLNIAQSGGATINEVASGAVAYQFNAGSQYSLVPDRKHRTIKLLGVADGALTALMYVALPNPITSGEGYDSTIRKGDSSTFGVTVVGFDTAVVAVADAGTDLLSFTGYNPSAGDPLILDGGTAPGGLTLGVIYFARDVSANTCKLAATLGGAAINISSAGSGLTARKGTRTLTRLGHSIQARVTGKTTLKWEQVAEGIRSSGFGQDLANAPDAAAAQTLLGPVTSIADGAVVQADLQADTLASLADTRPGVVDVLSGLTLVDDLSPPFGVLTAGTEVASLVGGGTAADTFTPSLPGKLSLHSSGGIRANVTSSTGILDSGADRSLASNVIIVSFVVHLTSGEETIFTIRNHATGFGFGLHLIAGNLILSVYTAAATAPNIFTVAHGSGPVIAGALTYDRATGTLRWAGNFGARYAEVTGLTQAANWVGPTTLTAGGFGPPFTTSCDIVNFGAKHYTSASLATRAQLEALVRDMEQHAARKIGHGDLALPLLQTVETVAAVPRGIGAAGTLMSAWVSGFGVTGSSPVTGITESHGLGTALTLSGSPALQSDGAVRIVCNGATASGLLSKNNVPDLLTARNILVMDVNSDVAGDWNGASLFRAFDSDPGYGFNLIYNGIAVYTGFNTTTTYTFTPKRGRQRIGVYIEFVPTSSFRYISLGRDQNMLSRPPFKVAGTFDFAAQDPTGQDGLDVWVGEGNLIAGRAGTHDIYGWRLLNGVPAGLSPDSIDALLLGEIDKLGRDSDAQLRLPAIPSPFTAGNPAFANQDMDGRGFFGVGQLTRTVTGTTGTFADDDRGQEVVCTNAVGCKVTFPDTGPAGSYRIRNASPTDPVSDAVWGTPSGQVVTITSASSGLPVIPTGYVFFVRSHSSSRNNGAYRASGTPTAASLTATKRWGAPVAGVAEAIDIKPGVEVIGSANVNIDGVSLPSIVIDDRPGNGLVFLEIRNTGSAPFGGAYGDLDAQQLIENPSEFRDALLLGAGAAINDEGPISASGPLRKDIHGGRVVLTTGSVTIPNTATDVGMGGIIKAGGAHTITFNSLASAALTAGDLVTYYVQSTTVIIARRSPVSDQMSFS